MANYEKYFETMRNELRTRKDRSAWDKGVTVYALELIDKLEEAAEYKNVLPLSAIECRAWMLNGAHDWIEYSEGGSSLVYDCDIAKRLCTPSELKRTQNGARRPNSREDWIKVQARALYQACARVLEAWKAVNAARPAAREIIEAVPVKVAAHH